MTADQLAAALTPAVIRTAIGEAQPMVWDRGLNLFSLDVVGAEEAAAAARVIIQALQHALTGTCQTCRHWMAEEFDDPPTYGHCMGVAGCSMTDPDFACNRWAIKEAE